MQHFRNPKNMGKMRNPDSVGQAGNPQCGDILKLYIKVKDNRIKGIQFETLGCAVAIAVSSVITEMVKNKTLDEAMKITEKDKKRMNNKFFQFFRFIVLNLKILKAVDRSKRS